MLWNKRKPTDPARVIPTADAAAAVDASPAGPAPSPSASSHRVAEPDRALTALGTLLDTYGRFAFDTEPEHSAGTVRERCQEWAQRIVLGVLGRTDGEPSASGGSGGDRVVSNPVGSRDWRGLERFFEEQRKREGEFVTENLRGLRRTVLALARSLSHSFGEDREADAQVEERLSGLSKAVEQGDVSAIKRAAASVIETSRGFMSQRRERQAQHARKLDRELRALRDAASDEDKRVGSDELTGLYGRAQYDQQLDQLSAIGALLEKPPWLLVFDVATGKPHIVKRNAKRDDNPKPVPDRTLREVSHCIARTFLRRQDFAARTGVRELSVLVTDMTEEEIVSATLRLLDGVRNAGRELSNSEKPLVSVGIVRLRANEDPERWKARADLAAQRASEDGGDGYTLSL